MKKLQSFFTPSHLKATRDYQMRAGNNKPDLCEKAREFGFDYWDGSRTTGYGGYKNDGRWEAFANNLIRHYNIKESDSVFDVGCGKGFLLEALQKQLPKIHLAGLDISEYAIKSAAPSISNFLQIGEINSFEGENNSFDYIFAINILHNLKIPQLFHALQKIEALKRKDAYICVESYRNQKEKWNLMRWQLTCECFYSPEEWLWIFSQCGYSGDYEFIYFE